MRVSGGGGADSPARACRFVSRTRGRRPLRLQAANGAAAAILLRSCGLFLRPNGLKWTTAEAFDVWVKISPRACRALFEISTLDARHARPAPLVELPWASLWPRAEISRNRIPAGCKLTYTMGGASPHMASGGSGEQASGTFERQGAGQGRRPRTRARGLAIRRQSVLYSFLLGVGSILIYLSGLKDLPLVTEGVAFIAIGAVGLIMSWTTQDIGQGIKDSVHDDGALTREGLREVTAAVRAVGVTMEQVGASVEAMAKDNREFFRKMLELQGAILDGQGAIRDKP